MPSDRPREAVIVELSIEARDVRALSTFSIRRWRRSLQWWELALCAMVAVTAGVTGATGMSSWAGAVFVGLFVVLHLWKRAAMMRRIAALLPSLRATIEADQYGVLVHRTGSQTRMSWTAFHDTAVTEAYIFLLVNPISGYIVPKRCFADGDDLSRFLAFVHPARQAWGPPTDLAR
jgi:hypothetical protein